MQHVFLNSKFTKRRFKMHEILDLQTKLWNLGHTIFEYSKDVEQILRRDGHLHMCCINREKKEPNTTFFSDAPNVDDTSLYRR